MIRNVQYSPEEYHRQKDILLQSNKLQFEKLFETLPRQGSCESSTATTGSFVTNSTNIENGYYSYNANNCRNVFFIGGNGGDENMYDMFVGGAIMGNHLYGCQGAGNSEHVYCSAIINDSSFLYYCIGCIGCNFCFGCTWLQNKSYCILNKQYTKEEWHQKIDEIFQKMEDDGVLGEFFPASMNPFYFNDTAAYLIDPSFTKEEVTKLGYLRRDEPIKVDIPEGAITVQSSELGQFEKWEEDPSGFATFPQREDPSSSAEIIGKKWKLDETVCKRVIIDEHGDAYRIIPMELEFLQKHELPLPRKHWLTRMKENFRIN